jgi:DNA-binding FadR family transcriptional regulator
MGNSARPIEKISSVDAVERQLRTDILVGRLAAGGKLRPERELAATLHVNRLTLRTALARLAAAGLVQAMHGEGNRVLDYRVSCGLDLLPELARTFAHDPATLLRLVGDMLALRRSLSADAAAAAARLATAADLALLQQIIARQRANAGDMRAFMQGDLDFTRAVLAIGGNLAFQLAFNTVTQFAALRPDVMELLFEAPEVHLRGYEAFAAIVATGEQDLARETVRQGLAALDERFIGRVRAYLRAGEPPAPIPLYPR